MSLNSLNRFECKNNGAFKVVSGMTRTACKVSPLQLLAKELPHKFLPFSTLFYRHDPVLPKLKLNALLSSLFLSEIPYETNKN